MLVDKHHLVVLATHLENPLDRNAHLSSANIMERSRTICNGGLLLSWPRQTREETVQDFLLPRITCQLLMRPLLLAPQIPQSSIIRHNRLAVSTCKTGTARPHRSQGQDRVHTSEGNLPTGGLPTEFLDPPLHVILSMRQSFCFSGLRVQCRHKGDMTWIDRDNAWVPVRLRFFLL